jgi:predicted nuclease of predicted toxin-antitoxin system
MKVVLDMNVSPQWVGLLEQRGHEVRHWSKIGLVDDTDKVIMEWARDNGFIAMTNDLDFGEILAVTNLQAPSVIQLRLGRNEPKRVAPFVGEAIEKCKDELKAGALVSINQNSYRVRLLPLKPELI